MDATRRSRAAEARFTLACAAAVLVLVSVVGLGSGWALTCREGGQATHAGFLDCAGQPHSQWRSDGLPNWVTPEMLLGTLAVALLVLAGSFADRHRARRRATNPPPHAR